ncbi:MAG: hypothetical protein JST59_02570 [Actinobacteria bacterium]|nr:hypothetical protein [Actinomycetota bacterium]
MFDSRWFAGIDKVDGAGLELPEDFTMLEVEERWQFHTGLIPDHNLAFEVALVKQHLQVVGVDVSEQLDFALQHPLMDLVVLDELQFVEAHILVEVVECVIAYQLHDLSGLVRKVLGHVVPQGIAYDEVEVVLDVPA